jgi:hypothetical protein
LFLKFSAKTIDNHKLSIKAKQQRVGATARKDSHLEKIFRKNLTTMNFPSGTKSGSLKSLDNHRVSFKASE